MQSDKKKKHQTDTLYTLDTSKLYQIVLMVLEIFIYFFIFRTILKHNYYLAPFLPIMFEA